MLASDGREYVEVGSARFNVGIFNYELRIVHAQKGELSELFDNGGRETRIRYACSNCCTCEQASTLQGYRHGQEGTQDRPVRIAIRGDLFLGNVRRFE